VPGQEGVFRLVWGERLISGQVKGGEEVEKGGGGAQRVIIIIKEREGRNAYK